jgi:hypothetical protein
MPLSTWDFKDPDEVLDYKIDWATNRLVAGDTITSSIWTITPAGLTKNSDSHTGTATTIWLSGGTAGEAYILLNRVVTAGGRTHDETVKLRVKSR